MGWLVMMLLRWSWIVLAGFALVVAVSCGGRGGVSISVSPSEVALSPGESVTFTATVVGGANRGVTWSASGGGLVPSGLTAVFTAPVESGEYTVTVRSAGDQGRWASATVTVAVGDVDGVGVLALRYSGLPVDGVSVLELRPVAGGGPVVRVDVSGPSGELELVLGAGEYRGVLGDVVGDALVGVGRRFFAAVGASPFSLVVGVGERVAREVEFVEVGEVAENVRVVRGDDLAAVESITGSTVRFSGRPPVLEGLASGDVLWFEFGADVSLTSVLGEGVVARASSGFWSGFAERWEDFLGLAEQVGHVVVALVEDGTGVSVTTVPASLANLVTRVSIDRTVSVESVHLVVPTGEGLPWGEVVSGSLELSGVEARLVLEARRVFTPPSTYQGLDVSLRPLVKPESLCVLGPGSGGWAFVGLNACSLWLVVEEFLLDVEIGEFDLDASLDFPFDSLSVVPVTIPLFHIGAAALAVNLELELDVGMPLVSVAARQPVSFRSAYANAGSGGEFEEDASSTPIEVTVSPFGGDHAMELSVDAVLSVSLALTDPTMHVQAFGRVGAGPELKVMLGHAEQHRDVWPFTVSAVGKAGGGLRAVWPDRTSEDWWVHSWDLFRWPLIGFSKYEFEGIADLPEGVSVWVRELPLGEAREVSTPFAVIASHAEHEVWVEPGGSLVPDWVSCDVVSGAVGDASLVLDAVGVEKVCVIGVDASDDRPVVVSPSSAVLALDQVQEFTAEVTGASDASVTWSASCGSIGGTGNTIIYTAPSTMPEGGVCLVRATSVADEEAWNEATVTVIGDEFGSVFMSVANVDDAPAEGVTVTLSGAGGTFSAVSDGAGVAEFHGVPAGDYAADVWLHYDEVGLYPLRDEYWGSRDVTVVALSSTSPSFMRDMPYMTDGLDFPPSVTVGTSVTVTNNVVNPGGRSVRGRLVLNHGDCVEAGCSTSGVAGSSTPGSSVGVVVTPTGTGEYRFYLALETNVDGSWRVTDQLDRFSFSFAVSPVAGFGSFTALSAGGGHSLALGPHGSAWGWGDNTAGQIGDDSASVRLIPTSTRMPEGITFVTISAGSSHSLAIDASGNAWAWGSGSFGRLGNGHRTVRYVPTAVTMPTGIAFADISAGDTHSLALDVSGNAWAWGFGASGQLGSGTVENEWLRPGRVSMPDGITFAAISAGGSRSLALDSDGKLWAWGAGTGALAPVRVVTPSSITFVSISAGHVHSLALDANGNAWAWGEGIGGQLGNGSRGSSSNPVAVSMPTGVSFTAVAAGWDYVSGRSHSLALDSSGNGWAWGAGDSGRLGSGSTDDQLTPMRVSMPSGVAFTNISAGRRHSVALDANGDAWAWGGSPQGQLGNGSTTQQLTPVPVSMPAGATGF